MIPWLWLWAPQYHYPWSGSVAQKIEPTTFFDSINAAAGDKRVEKRAFDVASYGRQLGLLTELLLEVAEKQKSLSPEARTAFERIQGIRDQIALIKNEEAATLARDIAAQVDRLKRLDQVEWQRLLATLSPLLNDDSA
jgi:hypothetical protein